MVFKSALEARSELFRMDLEGFAYQSPIEIIKGDMEAKMQEGVLRAVQKFDVNVDEEELRKALAYDRAQYEKGYADAMRFATDTNIGGKWIPVTERLPEKELAEDMSDLEVFPCLGFIKDGLREFCIEKVFYDGERKTFHDTTGIMRGVTHWMSLPEMPEEG